MAGLHLLVVLSCLGLAAAQTPLLGWSATANVFTDTTQVRAGANLEVSDAMAHLNNIFDTVPTVVVFAQDKVTTADFARYSQTSTYSYLKVRDHDAPHDALPACHPMSACRERFRGLWQAALVLGRAIAIPTWPAMRAHIQGAWRGRVPGVAS